MHNYIDEQRLRHARYHPLNTRRYPIQAQEAQTGPYYMPMAQPYQHYTPDDYGQYQGHYEQGQKVQPL